MGAASKNHPEVFLFFTCSAPITFFNSTPPPPSFFLETPAFDKSNLMLNTPPLSPHYIDVTRNIPIVTSKPANLSPTALQFVGLCASIVALFAFVLRRQWTGSKKKPAHFIVWYLKLVTDQISICMLRTVRCGAWCGLGTISFGCWQRRQLAWCTCRATCYQW